MRRNRRIVAPAARLAAGLALGLLVACDDMPLTTVTYQIDNAWRFAQPAMPLLIEIRGQPYPIDDETLGQIVTRSMTRAVTWYDTPRFTVDPAAAGSPSDRVVMTFNPARGAGGEAQCQGIVEGGAAEPGGTVRVLATFCSGSRVLVNVEGRVGRAGGSGDDRLPSLIRQIARDLFQQQRQ